MQQYVNKALECSESESEKTGADITELYRRRSNNCYRHTFPSSYQWSDQDSYRRCSCPKSAGVAATAPQPLPPQSSMPQEPQQLTVLQPPPPPPPNNLFFERMNNCPYSYKKTAQKSYHRSVSVARRYPVTAGTPRFFSCGSAPCKRPTTLSLPVACHPDPASHLPPKRTFSKRMELPDLDELIMKLTDDTKELSSLSDVTKILKPKIPASLKGKVENRANDNISQVTEAINLMDINQTIHRTDEKVKPSHSLDDTSALELHKSKCYIVNLIDKALSRELGTIADERITKEEFDKMHPKKVLNTINKHIAPNFECDNEKAAYIKHLKQLRWGHLRHIQHEAKRLADLERFLESFEET